MSKYRFPTDEEKHEYEDGLRRRVDKLLLKALAQHSVEASIDPNNKELVVGTRRFAEVDQWRVSVVDHSSVHRVYAEVGAKGAAELEVAVALESKPRIKIKQLVSHLLKQKTRQKR